MNWRRGLFRFWLVLSVVWAAVAVKASLSAWSTYIATVQSATATVDSNGNPLPEWYLDARRHDPPVQGYLAEEAAKLTDAELMALAGTPVITSDHPTGDEIKQARIRTIINAVGLALGAPLAVLALGISLFWAAKGFRENPT